MIPKISWAGGKTLFVGVGNPMKGDDGAGPRIAKALGKAGLDAIDAGVVPENFISKIKKSGASRVVFFDIADFGGRPGEVRIFNASEAKGLNLSTHAMPISLMSRLLEGKEVLLVAIQPKSVLFGDGISTEVKRSTDGLIREIIDELIEEKANKNKEGSK